MQRARVEAIDKEEPPCLKPLTRTSDGSARQVGPIGLQSDSTGQAKWLHDEPEWPACGVSGRVTVSKVEI